jgi:hypothetical protein
MAMGIGRWLGGRDEDRREPLTDAQAIERYRYMLRTAPPETIEQAHAEAFAQLNDRQRRAVLEELRQATPERERAAARGDDPETLARLATRAEVRRPGTLERVFGGDGGPGLGGVLAGSFLSSMAGTVIGSMIAREFFSHAMSPATADAAQDEPAVQDTSYDTDQVASDLDDDLGTDLDMDV